MDDKNKIKNLQMKIENLLIEKDIQKRSDALLRLENNKKQEKMIKDILKSKTDDTKTECKKSCFYEILFTIFILLIFIYFYKKYRSNLFI
tara:strand:+ start:22 stop:291 length:270 start_codon:yes stop_codon:yes gene_type:complete